MFFETKFKSNIKKSSIIELILIINVKKNISFSDLGSLKHGQTLMLV